MVFDALADIRWQDWTGNACYTLLAVSYLLRNIFWLRVVAIVSLLFEAMYFYYGAESPMWVGIGWNAVFVLINVVMLGLLVRESQARRHFNTDEAILRRGLFADFDDIDFKRLLKIGQWLEVPRGTMLARQHAGVEHFYAIADGLAEVEVNGRVIGILQNGAFIGEMSFLTNQPASATVTAVAVCRLFRIERASLDHLLAEHPEIQRRLDRIIGRDLAHKLQMTNQLPTPSIPA